MSIKKKICILLGLIFFITGVPAGAVYDLAAIDWCYWFDEESGYIDFYGIVKNVGTEDVRLPTAGVYILQVERLKPTGPFLVARMDFDLNREPNWIIPPGSLETLGPLKVPFDPDLTYSRLVLQLYPGNDQPTANDKFDIDLNILGKDLREDWTTVYAGEKPCNEKLRLGSRYR
jgi:hypothetical protein